MQLYDSDFLDLLDPEGSKAAAPKAVRAETGAARDSFGSMQFHGRDIDSRAVRQESVLINAVSCPGILILAR